MIVYVKIYDNTAKVQHYQCFFAPPQRFESLTACQKQQLSSLMKAAVSFFIFELFALTVSVIRFKNF